MRHIASVSFGKDSLAMLLRLIATGAQIDEVMFYDTGMEFQAIYDTRDKVMPLLQAKGIKYTELRPEHDFIYNMLHRPVNGRKNGFHYGYSWCGGRCRWGTTDKLRALDAYAEKQDAIVYVGIAADEKNRLAKECKPYKRFPLAEWGMTESNCLEYCDWEGYFWQEGDIRLYDILSRVSCWCCANKNLRELRNMRQYLPEYWEKLKELQRQTPRPMKGQGKSVFDLDMRFEEEDLKR